MNQIMWMVRPSDTIQAQALASVLGISTATAVLLLQRGCHSEEQCRRFLSPRRQDLTPPLSMQGMREAADIIRHAVDSQRLITIYGDYDVDGICSTVILRECLESLGAVVDYYIPDRFQEGYGLNMDAVHRLGAADCRLLITVDCGIRSVEEIAAAREMGMEVIVTDHHTPGEILPRANAIINPKLDHIEACRNLCGAGVAYQLARTLVTAAEDSTQWLDLVALATIADVVSLTGDNRILAREGLRCLNSTRRPGLSRLMEIGGIDPHQEISPRQVGYIIAPRLNAAGRLSHARLSLELLYTTAHDEACYLAEVLNRLNDERKSTEEIILREASLRISHQPQLLEKSILVLDGKQWHHGVLGIVASRLCEQHYKPVILINWDDNKGRGSCRSVEGFDIHAALQACSNNLLRFGGHSLAAGLTIEKEQLPSFMDELERWSQQHYPDEEALKRHFIDLELDPDEIDSRLWGEIQKMEPFGEGNPVPVLAVRAVELQRAAMVGQQGQHFKAQLPGPGLDVIAFGKPQYAAFNARHYRADIAFHLSRNEFQGRSSLQLKVKEMKPAYQPDHSRLDCMTPWLKKAIGHINEQQAVLLLAPTYRTMIKLRRSLELWFCNASLYSLHGHLPTSQRLLTEQARSARDAGLYIVTKAYRHYLSRRQIDILQVLPAIDLQADMAVQAEAVDHSAKSSFLAGCNLQSWYAGQSNHIPAGGRHIIYANRMQTIKAWQQKDRPLFVEAGLSDWQQRRLVRRRFAEAARGILLTDGYAGLYPIGEVDGVWLADLPFSAVEASQILTELGVGLSPAVGCLFNGDGVEYNWSYLKRLYPDAERIKYIYGGLRALNQGVLEGEAAVLCRRLSKILNAPLSPLDLQPVLHILADLGLCQIKKKGSIMAIMLLSHIKNSFDTADSPYYLEGLAAKKAFREWVKELQQIPLR